MAEISALTGGPVAKTKKPNEIETRQPETSTGSLISLARLAVDTGGRFTERTNDVTVAYARARHDLSCVYSLGFHDSGALDDRLRKVRVSVRRPGLRVMQPGLYLFRSNAAREESAIRAAFVSPAHSEGGVVRAHLFPLRPSSKKRWDGLLAVSFPMPPAVATGRPAQRDFGAVLSEGPAVAHSFNRRISLRPPDSSTSIGPRVVFLEPVTLAAGRYTLTVVVSDPEGQQTETARTEVTLPRVPRGELFLVGPVLGRAATSNLVVTGGGKVPDDDQVSADASFEPLLVQQVDGTEDLVALTQVCVVGSPRRGATPESADAPATISRSLRKAGGRALGTLPDVTVSLDGDATILCQNLLDVLPVSTLRPGEYVFEVLLRSQPDGEGQRQLVRFAVDRSTGGQRLSAR